MPKLKDIVLRSEEVQDILTAMPHWLIRWGNVLILSCLVVLFLFTWMIKYPDLVQAKIVITTEIPPEKLVAKSTGKLTHIFVTDKSYVSKNTPLAIIENPANYQDVFALKELIQAFSISQSTVDFPLESTVFLQLGSIESAYANFEKSYLAYSLNKKLQPYSIDKQAQHFEQVQQDLHLHLLMEKKEIVEKELGYRRIDVERYQRLYEKGAISLQELEGKNVEYLQQEKNSKDLLTEIIAVRSSLNELKKNKQTTALSESKDEIMLKRELFLSLNQLKKSIADWELAYVIQSSIDGRITFLQIWKENQNITAEDNVFVVIPSSDNFIGKIKATVLNSGKIKEGQVVNIRLDNYPDKEFGSVKGRVKSIALIPDKENNLFIDIELPEGLTTSFHKTLTFQQEMSGTADIVTADLRLIERIFYQFRVMFKR